MLHVPNSGDSLTWNWCSFCALQNTLQYGLLKKSYSKHTSNAIRNARWKITVYYWNTIALNMAGCLSAYIPKTDYTSLYSWKGPVFTHDKCYWHVSCQWSMYISFNLFIQCKFFHHPSYFLYYINHGNSKMKVLIDSHNFSLLCNTISHILMKKIIFAE